MTTLYYMNKAPIPRVPDHRTRLGELYRGDCLEVLAGLPENCADLIFADPPFNLGKSYASGMDDALPDIQYLAWCRQWIDACLRVLKPGGSFFLYNLPKWNLALGSYLSERLTFRHWIAIEMTYTLPISGRLYPSHYSLLYYCKGPRPTTFTPDRTAISTCPKCFHELKDYGGYKDKMNPAGVSLTDVWKDIPPVRHRKFKRRDDANELSIKLLDRVISLASRPGDLVIDPFGGSGSTYAVSELKERRWIGMETGPVQQIIARLDAANLSVEKGYLDTYRQEMNMLFPQDVAAQRKKRGIWTPGNIPKGKPRRQSEVPDMEYQPELVLQESQAAYGKKPGRLRKKSASSKVAVA
ncbi:MAG: site-specific DNA-methyltransferase [Opitutaceae bacterium]|jgi:site-specific DNA-methyltransferase (adenine-specific)